MEDYLFAPSFRLHSTYTIACQSWFRENAISFNQTALCEIWSKLILEMEVDL